MSNKDIIKENEGNEYEKAKAIQYKAQKSPSKLHDMKIVAYVADEEGKLIPVYRDEQ